MGGRERVTLARLSLSLSSLKEKRGIGHVAQHRDQEAITQRSQRGDIQGQIGLQKQPPPPFLRMAKRLEIGDAQPSYASFLSHSLSLSHAVVLLLLLYHRV
jgi:hypothetical protein